MEKLVFLFRRKPGTTRKEFYDYYVNVHTPLGFSLNPGLAGKTVNFVLSDGTDVDSVTEIWTPSALDLIEGKFFPTPEHREKSVADGRSFLGPADMYIVEESVILDNGFASAVGEAPWAKLITLHGEGDDAGEPPEGALRVTDNRVVRTLRTGHTIGARLGNETGRAAGGLALVRMIWAEDESAFPPAGDATSLRVLERCERVPTAR